MKQGETRIVGDEIDGSPFLDFGRDASTTPIDWSSPSKEMTSRSKPAGMPVSLRSRISKYVDLAVIECFHSKTRVIVLRYRAITCPRKARGTWPTANHVNITELARHRTEFLAAGHPFSSMPTAISQEWRSPATRTANTSPIEPPLTELPFQVYGALELP
jgi:hypothetical protein